MVKIDKKQYDHTLDRMVQFYREDHATIEALRAENESLKALCSDVAEIIENPRSDFNQICNAVAKLKKAGGENE